MICQHCSKEEATIKYYENINGKKAEIMLCGACAKKINLIDFPNMLSYFFNNYPKELLENEYTKQVCDKCFYTFNDYLKSGLFGCPDCYKAFSDRIDTLLNRLQEKSVKKTYTNVKNKNKEIDISAITDMDKLKILLCLSIKEEKYENAAKIRDRIKELI